MSMEFSNKVVVITGGGGVLCSTMATALAKQGAKVAVLDLKEENAKKVADQINKDGGTATGVAANVLEVDSLQKAKEEINASL